MVSLFCGKILDILIHKKVAAADQKKEEKRRLVLVKELKNLQNEMR